MELSYVFAVVITGLVVVFLGLVLLIAFISIIGKIFASIDKKKKDAKLPQTAKAAPEAAVPAKTAAVPAVQTADDDGELIAVISAAVAMMGEAEGKAYRVKSVRAAAGNSSSRSPWAAAGLRESTSPF